MPADVGIFFMRHYTQITIENLTESDQEIWIARLTEFGHIGFEQTSSSLIFYLDPDSSDATELLALLRSAPIEFQVQDIPEQNWNSIWETDFQPVKVMSKDGQKVSVHIKADFHDSDPDADLEICITPKMSFGTGHHATTYLMIESMSSIDFNSKSVFDFGTGTGILSIYAEKSGADTITAIDCDSWSIQNATDNFEKNNISKVKLIMADQCPDDGNQYDIILANINLNVISSNLQIIRNMMGVESVLLLSGFLSGDLKEMTTSLHNFNMIVEDKKEQNGWLLLKVSLSTVVKNSC